MNKASLILGSVVLIFVGCLLGIVIDHFCFRPDNKAERQQLQELIRRYNEELVVLKNNQILTEKELGRIKEDQLRIDEYKERLHNMEMAFANPFYPVLLALVVFTVLALALMFVVNNRNQTTDENLIELCNDTQDKLRIRTKAAPKPTVQLVQLGSSLDNASSTPQLENSSANGTPTLQIESDVQDDSSDSQTEDGAQQDKNDGASDSDASDQSESEE